MKLTGSLRQLNGHGSAFIMQDRILMYAGGGKSDLKRGVAKAKVIKLPSGKVLSEPKVPGGEFFRATDPGFVIIRLFGGHSAFMGPSNSRRAAAAELSTGMVIISETPALDVFGRLYVAEREKGEVGLYEIGKGIQASVMIPARP